VTLRTRRSRLYFLLYFSTDGGATPRNRFPFLFPFSQDPIFLLPPLLLPSSMSEVMACCLFFLLQLWGAMEEDFSSLYLFSWSKKHQRIHRGSIHFSFLSLSSRSMDADPPILFGPCQHDLLSLLLFFLLFTPSTTRGKSFYTSPSFLFAPKERPPPHFPFASDRG